MLARRGDSRARRRFQVVLTAWCVMNPHLEELATEFLAALEQDVRDRSRQDLPPTPAHSIASLALAPSRVHPEPGDVWTVDSHNREHLPVLVALVDVDAAGCDAVLVVNQHWLAATDDVVVTGDDSPTDEPLVVCTWRPLRVQRKFLVDWVGPLKPSYLRALRMLRSHSLHGDCNLRATRIEVIDGSFRGVRWTVSPAADAGDAVAFVSGPALAGVSDPRRRVRTALIDATTYLEGMLHPAVVGDAQAELPATDPAVAPVLDQDLATIARTDRGNTLGSRLGEPIGTRSFLQAITQALKSMGEQIAVKLVACSEAPTAAWASSSTECELNAVIDDSSRSQYVSLRLAPTGIGTIVGRFSQPSRLMVSLLDETTGVLIPIGLVGHDAGVAIELERGAGHTAVYAHLPTAVSPSAVRLLVWQKDAQSLS